MGDASKLVEASCKNECPICKLELPVPLFEEAGKGVDQIAGEQAVRISCGHAYHFECIFQNFRSGNRSCPLCRHDPQDQQHQTWAQLTVGNDGNLQIELRENELQYLGQQIRNAHGGQEVDADFQLDSNSGEDDLLAREDMLADKTLRAIQSRDPGVKAATGEFRAARKTYNVYRDELRKKRRDAVRKCMKEFRTEHHKEFRSVYKALDTAYEKVKTEERRAYDAEKGNGAFASKSYADFYRRLSAKDMVKECKSDELFGSRSTRRHDPLHRGFWMD